MQPLPPDPIERAVELRLAQEAEWVRRASEGDQDALVKLYERNIDQLYRYFYSRVENISEAEELTSETFTRAIKGLLRGDYSVQGKPFGSWLFGIAARVLKELKRESKDTSDMKDVDELPEYSQPANEGDILDSFVQQEERDALWQLVRELPVVEQRILVMRHVDGLSYAQIAKRLSRSEFACKQLHYRALERLKKKVHEAGL